MDNNRSFGRHIGQTPPDYSFCAGCLSCETVCALINDGIASPMRRRLTVRRDIRKMTHEILSCNHCSDHPCYEKCPKKGLAMKIDDNNIVYIDEDECIGCGLCAKACVFTPSRIIIDMAASKGRRKAKKCDLCREREEGPACVEYCPVRCLFLTEEG